MMAHILEELGLDIFVPNHLSCWGWISTNKSNQLD